MGATCSRAPATLESDSVDHEWYRSCLQHVAQRSEYRGVCGLRVDDGCAVRFHNRRAYIHCARSGRRSSAPVAVTLAARRVQQSEALGVSFCAEGSHTSRSRLHVASRAVLLHGSAKRASVSFIRLKARSSARSFGAALRSTERRGAGSSLPGFDRPRNDNEHHGHTAKVVMFPMPVLKASASYGATCALLLRWLSSTQRMTKRALATGRLVVKRTRLELRLQLELRWLRALTPDARIRRAWAFYRAYANHALPRQLSQMHLHVLHGICKAPVQASIAAGGRAVTALGTGFAAVEAR